MKIPKIASYTLMHKNISVVDIDIYSDERRTDIESIGEIHNPEHLPIGTLEQSKKDNTTPDHHKLETWLFGRSIPASRDGLKEAMDILKDYGIHSTSQLVLKSFALSLSDQYWLCPKDSEITWEDVNFFHNDFSTDVGEILLGNKPKDVDKIDFFSPDNTLDGWLKKKWIIVGGKRMLMKGGSGFTHQEPFNEVIASAIMKRLNIYHIPYTLIHEEDWKPYCLCEDFVTPDTELITAWRVMETAKKSNNDSYYTHLLRCCENLEIPDVKDALDKMLTLDFIIANEDRHYNNFGFIRNVETLKWEGFSPIFDSGTSLWYNTSFVGETVSCKPFHANHKKQLALVNDFSWLNFDLLASLEDEIKEIFIPSKRVDDSRAEMIATHTMENIKELA